MSESSGGKSILSVIGKMAMGVVKFLGAMLILLVLCLLLGFILDEGERALHVVVQVGLFCVVVWWIVMIYFLPAMIAVRRELDHGAAPVFWVNLVIGWSGIGWVGCLIWAVIGKTRVAGEIERMTHAKLLRDAA